MSISVRDDLSGADGGADPVRGLPVAWDWMAGKARFFPTRHGVGAGGRSRRSSVVGGEPGYATSGLGENDAPSKLRDEALFRRWYATRLRLSASPAAAAATLQRR